MNSRPARSSKVLTRKTAEETAQAKQEAVERADKWRQELEEKQRNSVPNAIAKLRTDAANNLAEADRLDRMYKEYPDLIRTVGRWEKVAYSSLSINEHVDDYDMRHNCGCCGDSPLEIWPYKKTEIGPIYSNPSKFIVGERSYLGGDAPIPNWETPLRDAKIPEAIIDRIRAYFKQCRDDLIESANDLYENGTSEEPEPLL